MYTDKDWELRTGFTKSDVENVFAGLYMEEYRNKFNGLENIDRMYLLREMCISIDKESRIDTEDYEEIAIKIEHIFEVCALVESIFFWDSVFEDINSNLKILKSLCYTKSEKYIELCNNQQSNYKHVKMKVVI